MTGTRRKWLIFLAAVLCLLLWRLIPRNIYALLDIPAGSVCRGQVSVVQANDAFRAEVSDREALDALMTILNGQGHRPSLRNLLPWKTRALTASGQSSMVTVTLIWGDGQGGRLMTFLKPESFGVSRGNFDVYYPLDGQTMEKLKAFAQNYASNS